MIYEVENIDSLMSAVICSLFIATPIVGVCGGGGVMLVIGKILVLQSSP